MADNSTQGGTDTIRDLARQAGTVKTQVFQLDMGGVTGNAEILATAGQQVAAASLPVVAASDVSSQPDLYITGQGSQLNLNQNVLLAAAGAGALDTTGYRFAYVQLVTGAGTVTAGVIKFEMSNDNVNFVQVQASTFANQNIDAGVGTGQIALTTSSSPLFCLPLTGRYLRFRISTALTGTTAGVQAFTLLKSGAPGFLPQTTALTIASGSLSTITTVTTANCIPKQTNNGNALVSAATTNATSVKTGAGQWLTLSMFNAGAAVAYLKLYNKASAPTVGTDVPSMVIPIAAGAFQTYEFGIAGMVHGTGLALAITNLVADTDTTAVVAGQIKLSYTYI